MYRDIQTYTTVTLIFRALSKFLTILPIPNNSSSAADNSAIVHFMYPNLALFPTWSTTSSNLKLEQKKKNHEIGCDSTTKILEHRLICVNICTDSDDPIHPV